MAFKKSAALTCAAAAFASTVRWMRPYTSMSHVALAAGVTIVVVVPRPVPVSPAPQCATAGVSLAVTAGKRPACASLRTSRASTQFAEAAMTVCFDTSPRSQGAEDWDRDRSPIMRRGPACRLASRSPNSSAAFLCLPSSGLERPLPDTNSSGPPCSPQRPQWPEPGLLAARRRSSPVAEAKRKLYASLGSAVFDRSWRKSYSAFETVYSFSGCANNEDLA